MQRLESLFLWTIGALVTGLSLAATAKAQPADTDPAAKSAQPASTESTPPPPEGTPAGHNAPAAHSAPASASQPDGATPLPPGFLRMEHDYLSGLQAFVYTTYPLTGPWGVAAGIYVAETYPSISLGDASSHPSLRQSWWSEFDLGPSVTLGPLSISLESGIVFDWAAKRAAALNAPQLYLTFDLKPLYFESWVWTILYSPFDTPANDYIHNRNWLLYRFSSVVALGPELEFNVNLNEKYGKGGLVSLPVGGRLELAFSASSSLALFVGYQTKAEGRGPEDQAAVGRFGLVHRL